MKKTLITIICFICTGCANLFVDTSRGITSFKDVAHGMTKQEVSAVMGNSVIIGYEIDQRAETFKPTTIPNPHRTEKVKKGNKIYVIDFYITHIRQFDGRITDDELTPFVYLDNKLMGTGWPYLNSILKER